MKYFSVRHEYGKSVVEDGKSVVEDGKSVAEDGKSVVEDGKSIAEDGKSVVEDGSAQNALSECYSHEIPPSPPKDVRSRHHADHFS
jgi:hypothetical protein